MPNHQFSLTPAMNDYLDRLMESGMYDNRDEIIHEALRLKIQQDQIHQTKLHKLQQEVALGAEQIEKGQIEEWDLKEFQKKLDLESV